MAKNKNRKLNNDTEFASEAAAAKNAKRSAQINANQNVSGNAYENDANF